MKKSFENHNGRNEVTEVSKMAHGSPVLIKYNYLEPQATQVLDVINIFNVYSHFSVTCRSNISFEN